MIEVNNLDWAFWTAKNPWCGEGIKYKEGAGGKDNEKMADGSWQENWGHEGRTTVHDHRSMFNAHRSMIHV